MRFAWLLVKLNYIQIIQQCLHRILLVQSFLVHLLFDVGKINQCQKLCKQLSFEILRRGNGHTPHIQPFFQICKSLFYQVSDSVKLYGFLRILNPVGKQDKIAKITLMFTNCISFGNNMQALLGSFADYEVFVIILQVSFRLLAAFQLILQAGQVLGKTQPLISALPVVEVYMDITPPLIAYAFPCPGLLFFVIPFIGKARCVQAYIIVVIFPADQLFSTDLINMLSGNFQSASNTYEELMVMLHQVINVLFAIETSVYNKAQLLHIQEINVHHQISYQADVCCISCKLAEINRKP